MESETDLTAIGKLAWLLPVDRADPMTGWSLKALGDLHRALKDALAEVEDALAPKIVAGSARGMTYTELAVAAGYGSPTTITKIMRDAGASPGRGSNQPMQRRRRRVA